MNELARTLNALMIITLAGVLFAAYGVQFFEHEEPCPLCMLQRLGMVGVACGALLNLRLGIQPAHYALCLLSAVFGGSIALRQISLHVCPGFPVFGRPVLGLSLYTWSFIVFACVITLISILLFLYKPEPKKLNALNLLEKAAFALIFLVAFLNIFTTFSECGFGLCAD